MNNVMGLGRLASRIGHSALDLLFPPKCAGCGREGSYLCDVCIAPFQMQGAAREVVHRLKYNGLRVMAEPMGAAMAQHLRRHQIVPDIIVPVPLHRKRLRERGYNQAGLLAQAVAQWLGGNGR
jgi:competence protein ComFC